MQDGIEIFPISFCLKQWCSFGVNRSHVHIFFDDDRKIDNDVIKQFPANSDSVQTRHRILKLHNLVLDR